MYLFLSFVFAWFNWVSVLVRCCIFMNTRPERGSSVVECQSRNQKSPGSNPLCYPFKMWAFSFSPQCPRSLTCIYTIICLTSVVVRKLQVAILARSPREMSQTDRIVWKHILSRVRVSVRPRIGFIREKTPNLSLIQSRPHVVYLNGSPTGHCLASVESGAPNHDGLIGRTDTATVRGGGGACSRVWACVRVRACMRECAMCLQYTIMIFYRGW